MNLRYLDFLIMLIMRYGEARMQLDYDSMYSSLKLLFSTVKFKIRKEDEARSDKVEADLTLLWDKLGTMIKKDGIGTILNYKPNMIRDYIKTSDDVYSIILELLDVRGMLTHKGINPNEAMGNFGGS